MPIDPYIALNIKPTQVLNPMEVAQASEKLRQLMGQSNRGPQVDAAEVAKSVALTQGQQIHNDTEQLNLDTQRDVNEAIQLAMPGGAEKFAADKMTKAGMKSGDIAEIVNPDSWTNPKFSATAQSALRSKGVKESDIQAMVSRLGTPMVQQSQGAQDAPATSGQPGRVGGVSAIMPNWDGAVQELYRRGRGQAAMALQQSIVSNQKNLTELQVKKLEHDSKQTEVIGQVLGAAKDQTSYNAALGLLSNFGVPTDNIQKQYDPAIVAQYVERGKTIQQQIDDKLKVSKEQREAAKDPAEQRKAVADASKAEAEATLATAKANLLDHPEKFSQVIDTLKLPPALAERTKAQVSFYLSKAGGGQIEQANKALDQAVEDANAPGKAASVASATAPIETAKAVATARATGPIEISKSIQVQKALRMGDNQAIQKVPPGEVGQVMTAAQKLDQAAIKANETTESIGRVLDLAESGNKSAGANVPLVGVGALNAVNGIKRINSAEIAQYGTAGSLLDKIQGKLQGWTEGQPIPKDVLDDMRTLHQTLAEQGYKAYTDGLNSLNDRTGAQFKPNVTPPNIRKAPGGPAVGTVEQGYKFKGGDPAKPESWEKVK